MSKLVSIVMSIPILFVLLTAITNAESSYDAGENARAGFVFDSLFETLSYIDKLDEDTIESNVYERDILEFLYYSFDGVYLPEGTTLSEISEIEVTSQYVNVEVRHNDIEMDLYSYHTSELGKEYTKSYIVGIEYERDDGEIVHYKNSLGDSYYCWTQGDNYYLMVMYRTPYSDDYLQLCHATYNSFSEAYSLTAESSDGKVKLSWDELVDDETYTIYWKRSSSDEWKVAGTTAKHKVNITGLKSGVSYDFKIEATGIESEVVTVTAE